MLQRLFRKNQETDPIRESAALTTVYLLELNQKFEAFVREKIAQLEPVVSSLEARGGRAEEDEWGDEPDLDKNEESPISDDEPPPLPETNLVTRMPSPTTDDPDSDIAPPATPPGKEPGRAHQSLRSETGVGASFSMGFDVDENTEGTSGGDLSWTKEVVDESAAHDANSDGDGVVVDEEVYFNDDGEEDEEMEDWQRALAGGDDDNLPTGPLKEYD